MRRRRAEPPIRRTAAGIVVNVPGWVRALVESSVRQLRQDVDVPGSAAAQRLLAPLDESAALDDPLVTLMRQHALDEVFDAVESSAPGDILSDAQAELWLEALGLVLAGRAAHLGLHTEDDRRSLSRRDEAFLQVVYAVQLGLVQALDQPPPASPMHATPPLPEA